jgi:hypothetical protein
MAFMVRTTRPQQDVVVVVGALGSPWTGPAMSVVTCSTRMKGRQREGRSERWASTTAVRACDRTVTKFSALKFIRSDFQRRVTDEPGELENLLQRSKIPWARLLTLRGHAESSRAILRTRVRIHIAPLVSIFRPRAAKQTTKVFIRGATQPTHKACSQLTFLHLLAKPLYGSMEHLVGRLREVR